MLVSAVFVVAGPFLYLQTVHARENHFAPSGWMGDYGDIRFDDHWQPAGRRTPRHYPLSPIPQSPTGERLGGDLLAKPANKLGQPSGRHNLNGMKKLVFKLPRKIKAAAGRRV